ncbi:MAG: hypothetical protein ACN4GR_02540 [Arenicellales bacterium]
MMLRTLVLATKLALSTGITTLTACTASTQPPETYLRLHGTAPLSMQHLTVCSLFGCVETTVVTLSNADWMLIDNIFSPPPNDSTEERKRIARAVAQFEKTVAVKAGTGDDQGGQQGMFRGTRQLDCVAETTNTTSYLILLQERGLMQWHAPQYPQHRGFMHGLFPHNTAVMEDLKTGEQYAVDTYFHANGIPPEIMPVSEWIAGFTPEVIHNSP